MGFGIFKRAQFNVLHVQFGFENLVVCGHGGSVFHHNGQLGQRLAHANLLRLTHRQGAGHDLAHLLHRINQSRIVNKHTAQFARFASLLVGKERPVGQMHGFATGQTTPHGFRFHRSKRRDHAHECFKHGVQRVERVRILVPETVTIVADVPVGEHVDKIGHGFTCIGNQEVIQRMLRLLDQSAGTCQQITVHFRQCGNLIGMQRTSIEPGTIIGSVRIQGEEVV